MNVKCNNYAQVFIILGCQDSPVMASLVVLSLSNWVFIRLINLPKLEFSPCQP